MLSQQGTRTKTVFYETHLGRMMLADSAIAMQNIGDQTVDLVMTSPPFALVRKKEYGNEASGDYLDWFRPFAKEVHRILSESGSFVLDIGGAWNPGTPTRSLYHFKLLIMLCEEFGFHLAQEFYWWNPSKLPTPAEWVTVRRLRAKDAVNTVWWLSKTPWPKASNRRVLQPYSASMETLMANGYHAKKRPSGHDISEKFTKNNGAAIPPNLIAVPNTESNSHYLRYCKEHGIAPHPARFPADLPEYFVRLTTDKDDLVVDPFAGSCATGEVCENLQRRWLCIDSERTYLEGGKGRFSSETRSSSNRRHTSYSVPHPGALWDGTPDDRLRSDGGRTR